MRLISSSSSHLALDVSDEEAKEIEKIDGVKRVSPNYEVHTMLQNSVPLIGANEVWQMDRNLQQCDDTDANTENDCLTGKGVTIAIIDTGVDYTHADLGGCSPTININDGSCSKVIGGYDFVNFDNNNPIMLYQKQLLLQSIGGKNGTQ